MKNLTLFILLILTINFTNAQWQKTNGPYNSNIICFAKSGSKIFALGSNSGVFISTNNGTSWETVNNGLPTSSISYYSIVKFGTNLFLGTSKGIYLSTDYGDNWIEVNIGLPLNTKVYSLFNDDNNIYAGTTNGLYLSNNNGSEWVVASTGMPLNTIILSLAGSGSNIFAGTTNGVYRSNDNGNSWTEVNNGIPVSFIFSIAVEDSYIYLATSDNIYLSIDNGNSWTEVGAQFSTSFRIFLQINEGNIYAGTSTGLYTSTDNGNNWTLLKEGLTNLFNPNSIIKAILINGTDIFAGGKDGICLSMNSGETWNYINDGLPYSGVLTLATNGEFVYAGTENGLFVFDDLENKWIQKFNKFTSSLIAKDTNVYLGSNFGIIYVSNNHAKDWIISTGFFDNGQDVIAVTDSTVFAKYNASIFGSGIGFISIDNGVTFTMQDFSYSIFSNRSDDALFAIDNSTVFHFDGANWNSVSSVINGDSIYSLGVNASKLFVGTEGGILISTYNGNSWSKVNFGLSDAKVTSLVVNGINIYACTTNNDLFSSSDNGNTWMSITDNFTDTIISKKPYGIDVAQFVINDSHIFVGGKNGVWKRPLSEVTEIKENIYNSEVKIYPNPTSGRFTIKGNEIDFISVYNDLGKIVYNALGKEIQSLEIDLSDLPKGIYFIMINGNEKVYTRKIIIQ